MTGTRLRKAWAIRTTSHDICDPDDIKYAPTRAKARAAVIDNMRDAWGCSWLAAAEAITSIRRAPERDVVLPARHPLADQIGAKLLDNVVHAYGGTGLKAGYRDYYYTSSDDSELLELADLGLFLRGQVVPKAFGGEKPYAYFHLTDLGKQVAASVQPEYPTYG